MSDYSDERDHMQREKDYWAKNRGYCRCGREIPKSEDECGACLLKAEQTCTELTELTELGGL